MKNTKTTLVLGLALLLLSGCSPANSDEVNSSDTQELQTMLSDMEEEIASQSSEIEALEKELDEKEEAIDALSQDFTFLDAFGSEEMTSYEQFLETNDVGHLNGFSPENIMLLYFHAAIVNDLDTVYSLTYNNGTLPDVDEFKDRQHEVGYLILEIDELLMFRDYNFIEAREENRTDDYVSVEINGGYGTYGYSTIYGLKKDQNVWKMDTLN